MKVYYRIPDDSNDMANKMLAMLYENMKLRILLAVQPVKPITDKENGIIIIERLKEEVVIRYEGWKPETELILKFLVADIKNSQKVRS